METNKSKKIWKLSHGKDFSKDEVQNYLNESTACVHKDTPAKGISSLPQGKAFTSEAKAGDLFYLCHGNQEILLIGEFVSDEVEIDNDGWAYRKYKKLYSSIKKGSYQGPNKWWTPNNNSTFIEIKQSEYQDFEESILMPFFGIDLQTLNLVSGDNKMNENVEKYKELLIENKNIILHGAPGTGKTYLAKQIAKSMEAEIGFCQFHPSYDYTDFVEGLRPTKNNGFERKDGTFKAFCKKALQNLIDSEKSIAQIQTELSWQEKIIIFLDELIENKTEIPLKRNGFFLVENYHEDIVDISLPENNAHNSDTIHISKLLKTLNANQDFDRALDIENYIGGYHSAEYSYIFAIYKVIKEYKFNTSDLSMQTGTEVNKKDFIFIIDEINRGELSKIFGELFFSIDPGYRGEEGRVNTQYQNLIEDDLFKDGFYIPENVYIIGTMNDIDRSVESMDFAMRRRFIFEEVTAANSADNMLLPLDIKQRMKRINDQISKTEGLNSAYHIGGAYFRNVTDFDKLWNLKLSSLVKEYLRGMDDDDSKYNKIKNAYFDKSETTAENETETGVTIEE